MPYKELLEVEDAELISEAVTKLLNVTKGHIKKLRTTAGSYNNREQVYTKIYEAEEKVKRLEKLESFCAEEAAH